MAAALLASGGGQGWRPASVAAFDITLRCDDTTQTLRVRLHNDGTTDAGNHGVRIPVAYDLNAVCAVAMANRRLSAGCFSLRRPPSSASRKPI